MPIVSPTSAWRAGYRSRCWQGPARGGFGRFRRRKTADSGALRRHTGRQKHPHVGKSAWLRNTGTGSAGYFRLVQIPQKDPAAPHCRAIKGYQPVQVCRGLHHKNGPPASLHPICSPALQCLLIPNVLHWPGKIGPLAYQKIHLFRQLLQKGAIGLSSVSPEIDGIEQRLPAPPPPAAYSCQTRSGHRDRGLPVSAPIRMGRPCSRKPAGLGVCRPRYRFAVRSTFQARHPR